MLSLPVLLKPLLLREFFKPKERLAGTTMRPVTALHSLCVRHGYSLVTTNVIGYGHATMSPWLLYLIIAFAALALASVAHASPPDQTWIGGLYDDANYDRIILKITSGLGTAESDASSSLQDDAHDHGRPARLSPAVDMSPGPTRSSASNT
jgi:hypothetical protein